jgi:hypothetical protein
LTLKDMATLQVYLVANSHSADLGKALAWSICNARAMRLTS